MSDSAPNLRSAREATIDALCEGFAADELSLGELDRRLERARAASSREELRSLLADLSAARPPPPAPAPASKRGRAPAEPADATRTGQPVPRRSGEIRPGSHVAFAVLGGTRRAGKWHPPGRMLAVAIMGGVELDFREAVLSPGVTEVNVFAFWGGIEITVPPNVHVDTHGLAILGGFEQDAELETAPAADAPTIRINGAAIMGGVDVKVRRPGETTKEGKTRENRTI